MSLVRSSLTAAFTVELHAPTIKREDTKIRSCRSHPPPPALGRRAGRPRTANTNSSWIECCLYLRFLNGLTRERVAADAMSRDRLAHWRQPVLCSSALLRFFVSSILRRKPWVRVSVSVNTADCQGLRCKSSGKRK